MPYRVADFNIALSICEAFPTCESREMKIELALVLNSARLAATFVQRLSWFSALRAIEAHIHLS